MKRTLLLFLCPMILFIVACQPKSETASEASGNPTAPTTSPTASGSSCYMSIINQDTFKLRLRFIDIMATGTLDYSYHDKDKNVGQITGVVKGDTLLADYTFMSEGRTSVRQVAFLLDAHQASEGYGALEEKNGKMIFQNKKALVFGRGVKMDRIDCDRFVSK